jgi:hypothetical protein
MLRPKLEAGGPKPTTPASTDRLNGRLVIASKAGTDFRYDDFLVEDLTE